MILRLMSVFALVLACTAFASKSEARDCSCKAFKPICVPGKKMGEGYKNALKKAIILHIASTDADGKPGKSRCPMGKITLDTPISHCRNYQLNLDERDVRGVNDQLVKIGKRETCMPWLGPRSFPSAGGYNCNESTGKCVKRAATVGEIANSVVARSEWGRCVSTPEDRCQGIGCALLAPMMDSFMTNVNKALAGCSN